MHEHWLEKPESHDYDAAASYLSLLMAPIEARHHADRLRHAGAVEHYKAKDILRASKLPLLDEDNKHVAADLAKVHDGTKLSPVLLIRGRADLDAPLTIADGYHRVCASYWIDENSDIPCRIVD